MKKVLSSIAVAACLLLTGAGSRKGAEATIPAIGTRATDFHFTDLRYLPRSVDELSPGIPCAVIFTAGSNGVSRSALARLAPLARSRVDQIQFLCIDVGDALSIPELAFIAMQENLPFPCGKDFDGSCARALGAKKAGEAVLLDPQHRIVYRGSHGADLDAAIDALLSGRSPRSGRAKSSGPALPDLAPSRHRNLTYARDIAPILEKHCLACHRPGGGAPFSLDRYEVVRAKASTIAEVAREGRMPPWFAHPAFGSFTNERKLSPAERRLLAEWAEGDRAPGPAISTPAKRRDPEGWEIGSPDLIVEAEKSVDLPANGYLPYHYLTLPYVFPRDTWIQGAEIRPSNARVMHHAILGYVMPGSAETPEQTIILGKVPGGQPLDLHSGVAKMIPKGARLLLEIHYVTTGKPETDRVSVGIRYAKETVRKSRRFLVIEDKSFAIPPGAPMHPSSASRVMECDAQPLDLLLHMHLRGRDGTLWSETPGGKKERMLVVPNYSFNWQLTYQFADSTPALPKGTRLELVSHFDNSKFNPYNPAPGETVSYGRQTHEEMMAGWFFYTDVNERLDIAVDPKTGGVVSPHPLAVKQ